VPQFSNLGSDYPLNLTLFGSMYMPSLKRAFVATDSGVFRVSIVSALVGKSWLISDFQVQCLLLCASHILDGNANCNGFQPRGCTHTRPRDTANLSVVHLQANHLLRWLPCAYRSGSLSFTL